MLDPKLQQILEVLEGSEGKYLSAAELAQICKISTRTIQTRIKELRSVLNQYGASIESKQHSGYRLHFQNRVQYEQWKNVELTNTTSALPNSEQERFQYLLEKFLTKNEYYKLENLSEELCISSKTLSNELKQLEYVLSRYDLRLERKPYYGVRLNGSEFSMRKCCMDYLPGSGASEEKIQSISRKIGKVLLQIMLRRKVKFSEAAFQNIVSYLTVVHFRNQTKHFADAEISQLQKVQALTEYRIAGELIQELNASGMNFANCPAELLYITVFIAGHRIANEEYYAAGNTAISYTVNQLIGMMLDCMQRIYNLDFHDNLNIRISLYNHIAPFHIRMLYHIPLRNPILKEIKQNYPYAYTMAQRCMADFSAFYDHEVSEDETGYFAVILEMSIESQKRSCEKHNVLLVCMTGKSSSQFLSFRFRSEFGSYIDRLEICSLYEFEHYDLHGHQIDYIFTTVPLQTTLNIPIYEISSFLDSNDVSQVRKKLELGDSEFLRHYYRKELFFPHLQGQTWEEVIRELCHCMAQAYPIPEREFTESVLKREHLASTDFGNETAIPHPEDCFVKENVVCVGILDKPIRWVRNSVQLVILAAIYDSTSSETQRFYQVTNEFLADRKKVQQAISHQNYNDFIMLFQK